MMVITLWSLLIFVIKWRLSVIGVAAFVQIVLALWIVYEGVLALKKLKEEV